MRRNARRMLGSAREQPSPLARIITPKCYLSALLLRWQGRMQVCTRCWLVVWEMGARESVASDQAVDRKMRNLSSFCLDRRFCLVMMNVEVRGTSARE